ncbi:Protein of unknown function [Mariniphaga anaerophila]|uniref:DUF4199 domain-containing protein n=1 Tax=Mariniphaga anaerophila TaxID=1484053 RepID=A0A1M4VZZ9_9BACT|nr:DUF4199 domain-containing protein [Mariniphaga anaerophila]SHE74527.1 Protein of unknown function [Mariniphaga anaerophila]
MEQKPVSLWKSSLTYGIYLGLISILLSVIIYITGLIEKLGLMGTALIGIASLVLTFVFLLIFSKNYRKEMGGYISFSDAFQFGLLAILFSVILSTVYNYIFHTLIDPEYTKNIMMVMQQKTITYMENAGVPETQIDKAIEKFEDLPSLWDTLRQGIVSGLISGVILSLITAAIVKKKEEFSTEI